MFRPCHAAFAIRFADLRLPCWVPCLALLALSGCSTVSYYGQLASGQFALLRAREPAAAVIADPQRDARFARTPGEGGKGPAIRQRTPRPAGQPQLSPVRRYRPALRGMERVRHPGAVAAAGHPLLPHRRLRGLPRLLQRGRRARRGGAPAGARRRRLRRRGAGLLDPRLVRRSDPQQHAALGRRTAGDLDLPRTGAPEVLPARRHRLQRILRHLRRTGRYPPVARVSWTAAGGRPRGEAPRAVHPRWSWPVVRASKHFMPGRWTMPPSVPARLPNSSACAASTRR